MKKKSEIQHLSSVRSTFWAVTVREEYGDWCARQTDHTCQREVSYNCNFSHFKREKSATIFTPGNNGKPLSRMEGSQCATNTQPQCHLELLCMQFLSVQLFLMLCIILFKYIKYWIYFHIITPHRLFTEERVQNPIYVCQTTSGTVQSLCVHVAFSTQNDQFKHNHNRLVGLALCLSIVSALLTQSNGLTFIQPHIFNLLSSKMHNVQGPWLKPDINCWVCPVVKTGKQWLCWRCGWSTLAWLKFKVVEGWINAT